MRQTKEKGLSLLEALVALAIIGAGFGAVLNLQAQLVRSVNTLERAHERALWRLNALEVAAGVERDEDRDGEWVFDGNRIVVSWSQTTDRPLTRPNREGKRQRGIWQITLAPISVSVRRDGRPVLEEAPLAVSARLSSPPQGGL